MAEPKVSILLSLVDKLSGPAESARTGLGKLGTSLKNVGNEAMQLLNNRLIQGVGLAGLGVALNKSFQAADSFRIALQKLEGTAKITGVPLEFLQEIAATAARDFGLSKAQASDFAVEMAKLASKAGDVANAGPGLQAFLDIGAARGLTAAETLKAVQQSILGIDEGTDKLFNANPSVLYERFADSIGTTAGNLTDQQEAQALLNAAMEDGSKVMGTYQDFLGTTAGQLQLMRNKTEEAYASLGVALDDLRNSTASAVGWIANAATEFIGGVQLMGAGLSAFLMAIPERLTLAMGMALGALAGLVEKAGAIPIIGEKFAGVADSMTASADRMKAESKQALDNIREGYESVAAEIVGVVVGGEKKQTAAVVAGGTARTGATTEEGKAREKIASESSKALAALQQAELQSQLEMLSAQQREYREMVALFQREMQNMTAADYRKAEELLKQTHLNMLMKWSGLNRELVPMIREPVLQLKPIITEFGEQVAKAAPDQAQHEKWGRLKNSIAETGTAIGKGAEEILRFGRDIGVTNPQLEALVGGIGRLAEGIGGIASGNLIGGIASGILGLQGIVGSLFGNSPAEQARKAMLERNTDALTRLRGSIGDLMTANTPGATIAKFRGVSFESVVSGSFHTGKDNNYGKLSAAGVSRILMKAGLTLTDMRTLAKDLNIDLGEKDGFFDPARIQQFFQAMNSSEFARFDQTFAGQQDFLQTYFNVAGITDPGQQAAFAAANLGKIDPASGKPNNGFLSDLIGQYDLDTPEGRAGLQTAFAGILQNLNNGTFDVGEFGELTGSQFVQFIEYFTGLLQQMGSGGAGAVAASGPSFSATAPSGAAPVTVTAQAAADLLGPITETAVNTRRTAEGMEQLLGLVGSGALSPTIVSGGLGNSMEQIDAALAAERDLRAAAGVVS
jgi:hypothetical protein